jgi:hypothetical protein
MPREILNKSPQSQHQLLNVIMKIIMWMFFGKQTQHARWTNDEMIGASDSGAPLHPSAKEDYFPTILEKKTEKRIRILEKRW